ncbi:hypothetical protein ACPPVO_13790 [Dactylosporangium sp. McL0621]|uniref:hypothetical protein n=1 Tax=Dactylosporangium sp. McL0621 TaxID=3415678 RepID=UPI003CFA76FD
MPDAGGRWTNAAEAAARLPDIAALHRRCRALAMLETITVRDAYYRAFSYRAGRATYHNGSGDHLVLAFTDAGALVHGFDHESPMSPWANDDEVWPGLLDGVPAPLAPLLSHPFLTGDAGDPPSVTLCLWREPDDALWRTGPVEFAGSDGADMLRILAGPDPDTYAAFAADIHGTTLDTEAVARVCALEPLTPALVHALAPGTDFVEIAAEAVRAGFPTAP